MMTPEEEATNIAEGNKFIAAVKRVLPKTLRELLALETTIKIVDIGANLVEGPAPYVPLLSSGRAHVVGFEPHPIALSELNAAKGQHETYLPYAIGDGQPQTLHICAMPSLSSLLQPNPKVLSLFFSFKEWGTVVRKLDIVTARLDDVPETEGVDYLKIDIQGAELMVFKNATERLKSTLLIHTEVEFLEMYEGQPLFSEVETFLRASGFVLHKFDPMVTRDFAPMLLSYDKQAGHSQVLWADAVFVRDFTRLELMSADQLLRLSEILYDCYGSLDLVLLLLREHDLRTGGDFGQKFFNMVRLLVSETPPPKIDG
jgi:FkbM family methyltransferase